jgi:glycosyltransferase involved in cell wall biosynthesis
VTLTIVGEGPERERLETWIRTHHAQAWVTLAGRISREELRSLYRGSWLITSASLTEGWGLTLTEAAGCGTPAVATDVSGHRSSVLHEKTGRLAPLSSLGETLAELLLDHSSRQVFGVAAEKWARTLSWDLLAEQVLAPLHFEVVRKRTH